MGTIAPASILAAIGPLDREVAPGWRLEDVRWGDHGGRIDVELRREHEVLICTLDADTRRRLRVGYTDRDSTWSAPDLHRYELAKQVLGPLLARFEGESLGHNDGVAVPQVRARVDAWAKVPWPTAGEQWRLLAGMREPYRRVFKTKVQLLKHEAGLSLHFPIDTVLPSSLYARFSVPLRFRRREFREYFADLGFGIDERGEMNIVPTPDTFVRCVKSVNPEWPFGQRFQSVVRNLTEAQWAAIWLDNEMPMTVTHAQHQHTAGIFVHDLGFHGCLFHRIKSRQWESISSVLRAGVAESGEAAQAQAGAFIEGALSLSATRAWNDCVHPHEFDEHFAARMPLTLDIARARMNVAAGRIAVAAVPAVH